VIKIEFVQEINEPCLNIKSSSVISSPWLVLEIKLNELSLNVQISNLNSA
jgi:hypothetical protein